MIDYKFILSKKESKKADKIIRKWNKEYQKHMKDRYVGVSVTFLITPTGLGNGTEILNTYTGEIVDITDHDSW